MAPCTVRSQDRRGQRAERVPWRNDPCGWGRSKGMAREAKCPVEVPLPASVVLSPYIPHLHQWHTSWSVT